MRLILVLFTLLFSFPAVAASESSPQVEAYTQLVYQSYQLLHHDAQDLQKNIDSFLDAPTEKNRKAAQNSWLKLRGTYSGTETFRFYDGPADKKQLTLNQWPVDYNFIDSIIADSKTPLSAENLLERNQEFDEMQITVGLNVIEYFLWKKDLENEREKQYLRIITEQALIDIKFLEDSWEPQKPNYAGEFLNTPPNQTLGQIILGIIVLSGFELGSNRLENHDTSDDYSYLSKSTKQEFIGALKGVRNVYFGTGLNRLVEKKEKTLADKISAQILRSEQLANAPIEKDSSRRALVDSLQIQAGLFKQAAIKLNLDIGNVAE